VRPRLGISSCLLGESVRYDGAHKRDAFAVEALGPHVEWVPVCPEVELGLGVPREPIQLEPGGASSGPRLRSVSTRRDLTEAMATYALGRVAALATLRLSGYVLKARSPSCGPGGVPVVGSGRTAPGAFAAVLRGRLPHLPVVHEEGLARPAAREAFLAAAFALARWHAAAPDESPAGRERLRALMARERLLLLSRDEGAVEDVEALLAAPEPEPREVLARVMTALGRVPAPVDHLHALQHAADLLRRAFSSIEHATLAAALDAYADGEASLARALGELRELAERRGATALLQQTYFEPHPRALRLLDAI
jgi:uncharacterized protein YbbK (DUF523 family)/uncharacterized protein YbgA (DUF1722 family)